MMRRDGSNPFVGRVDPWSGLELDVYTAGPSPSMAGSQRPTRGVRTRFHQSESPTAIATSNPPAPANHDAMSTCLFATVT